MTTETKFRAWYSGKMIEVWQLDFFTNGQICVNGELIGAKLMQYIGLDKNGKEIYKSDVLEICRGSKYENRIYVIDSLQEFFEDKGYYEVECGENWNKCKIIGNIYENPELLKQ